MDLWHPQRPALRSRYHGQCTRRGRTGLLESTREAKVGRERGGVASALSSILDVFVNCLCADGCGIDVAVGIRGDTFRRRQLRIADRRRWNIIIDLAGFHAAHPDAALTARIVGVLAGRIFRFRIRYVERVIAVDEDSARAAELFPGGEEFSVLIENRNTTVAAVGHEQPSLRIECEHMWALQFAVARTEMAE